MRPENLDMYDDSAENNVLFETVATEQDPVPMEIIAVDNSNLQDHEPAGDASTAADDEFKGTYTWEIENFSRITAAKEHSPKFEIGTHFWKLLIFPKGNPSQSPQQACLSVYLEFTEASFTPALMCPKASFELHLVNKQDPSLNITKATKHTFSASETDWGFTQFHPLAEVLDPSKGFLVNDTLTLKVEITVQRDERYSYDSRKQTGCVGLKNQGATCYMNSLLQYLFHIPMFRKAVYHMPTPETDEASNSIPVALQSVFYKLQYSKTSSSTKDLTKSFGWNTLDAFTQHDVQEFNRVLCDKLEEKMKGTKVERAINELFEGHVYNYIECVNVNYKSTRVESYMDLQLDVKGCKDIYASFDKYVEMEKLDGDNQYRTDDYGLQDARKGVQFEEFPPVLQLQLKRFEYDFQRDCMVKINDRYEFYDELDLDVDGGKYLSPNADRSVRNKYRLHSVLVHSGGVHGGHYYAFIRPKKEPTGEWMKFDDEKVTKEDSKRALDEQFGGEDEAAAPGGGGFNQAPAMKFTKYSNAYMLVYVRESDWERIFCDVGEEDLAPHLRKMLQMELGQKEQRHRDKMEAHLYCNLKIAVDSHMAEQVGKTRYFDLIDPDKVSSYRLKKQTKFRDFKAMVERDLGIPVDHQRYWTWRKRENKTYRPDTLLPNQREDQDLMDLREHRENKGTSAASNKAALMDIRFYLEGPKEGLPFPADNRIATGSPHHQSNPDAYILIFLKFYDPYQQELTFLSHTYLKFKGKVGDLYPLVRQLAGLPDTVQLTAFEEVKQEPTVMVDHLDPAATPATFEGQNGDILIFQPVVPADTDLPHPTVQQFLNYIRNRRRVEFRPRDRYKDEGFKLELRSNMNYDEVVDRIAKHPAVNAPDGTHIRLTQYSTYMNAPQNKPLKYRERNDLDFILQHMNHTTDILYFEVLDMPLPELEKLKSIRLHFYNEKVELVTDKVLRVPKDSTVEQLLQELRSTLEPSAQPKQQMRLLEVHNSGIFKEMTLDAMVDNLDDGYWQLRAEEVSEEELQMAEDPAAKRVQVQHIPPPKEGSLQASSVFGDPFYIVIRETDGLVDVRSRIQKKLCIPDDEFSKWKLCVLHRGVSSQPPQYLEEDEDIFHKFDKAQALDPLSIGLEHEEKGPRRQHTRQTPSYERAIKIYN